MVMCKLAPSDRKLRTLAGSGAETLTQADIDRLAQIKGLLDEAIITPDEYEYEKEKIMRHEY